MNRKARMLAVAALSMSTGGCAWMFNDLHFPHEQQSSTPLVDFLYTEGKVPELDAQPELKLPIRVALSFLPRGAGPNSFQPGAIDREKVLNQVREHFRSLPYVSEIIIVPDYYLHAGKGDGLMQIEQLSRLYHFDLFALVSYDQLQLSYQTDRSFLYFTIVGAYVVRGDRNSTHTLLDLAVIDPKSRALVMRAGGTSKLSANATAIDASRQADAQSVRGFEVATEQLIGNFSRELTAFEARVRDGTAPVKVVKSGGAGALDYSMLALLLGCLALSVVMRHAIRVRRRFAGVFRIGFSPGSSLASRGMRSSASARS